MMSPRGFRHLLSVDGHEFGIVENVFCCWATREPGPSTLGPAARAYRSVAEEGGRGVLITAVHADARPPSEVARRAITEFFAEMQVLIQGAALVVEGGGFMAAAKRGALSFLSMTSRHPFPFVISASVASAVQSLGQRGVEIRPSTPRVEAAFADLRRLGASPAPSPTA